MIAICFSWVSLAAFSQEIETAAKEEEPAPPVAETPDASAKKKSLPPLQDADDVTEPLNPKNPPKPEDAQRVSSAAWYMAGRLLESRNDFNGALAAYKKAVEMNPRAIEAYRSLIPLAYSLNQPADALKYAMMAIEVDPDDYQMMHRLGVQLASERKIPDSIRILEKALLSKRLAHDSADFVNLHRDLAFLYEETQQIEQAASSFEKVFDALKQPLKYHLDSEQRDILLKDATQTYEHLGDIFLKAKRTELAIQAYQKGGEASGKKPSNLHYNLAQVYRQTQQPEQALAELQQYLDAKQHSKGKEAYQLLSDILTDLNRQPELIPLLESHYSKDEKNKSLQYFLASQYVAADKLTEAEALYQKSLNNAVDSEAYAGLAGIYRRQQKPAELLIVLSKAIQSQEGLELLQQELEIIAKDLPLMEGLIKAGREAATGDNPTLDFGGSLILAKLAAEVKQTDAAIEFYRFAIQARADRAAVLYEELGNHLMQVDRNADAVKIFQEAVNDAGLANARPNFQYKLSQALEMNGETDAALEAIREAQKEIPDHPLLKYQEGWINYHARRWDEAIPHFEKVIAQNSDPKFVRLSQLSLSNVYVLQGDIGKGEAILEKVFAEDPEDPSINNDLGYLYADQGKNLEQAEQMIRKAIAVDPDNAAYLDSLGWVLFKLNKFEEAFPHLEKAAAAPGGGDATIWEHLGDCQQKLGRDADAQTSWKKSLESTEKEKFPDEKLIQRLREKIKP
ncbi:MAG: tetratricopeptide repeat protein [Planctomycetaceae bacterium]